MLIQKLLCMPQWELNYPRVAITKEQVFWQHCQCLVLIKCFVKYILIKSTLSINITALSYPILIWGQDCWLCKQHTGEMAQWHTLAGKSQKLTVLRPTWKDEKENSAAFFMGMHPSGHVSNVILNLGYPRPDHKVVSTMLYLVVLHLWGRTVLCAVTSLYKDENNRLPFPMLQWEHCSFQMQFSWLLIIFKRASV